MIIGKRDIPIGEGLVRIGALTPGQREQVLQKQKQGDRRLFGQIAVASNFVSEETIKNYLRDVNSVRPSKWS